VKVLLCHNYYQHAGGEDESFAAEARLLESRGHEVLRYELDNETIKQMRGWSVAARALWNRASYRELRDLIRRERPSVMHCTNTFPLISPAAYSAARREGVAVVQSLRNYRLLCPNALFLRDGRPCEDCFGKAVAWPGVRHACYRDSRAATAVVTAMQTVHRGLGTWRKMVDMYFAPSEFTRQKHVAAGFPADRVAVKPDFLDADPGVGAGRGGYAIFVGRLSAEKGLDTLLDAWRAGGSRLPLKVVGDGPLAPQVREAAARQGHIELLGRRPLNEVLALVGEAACLVMPSRCYETFGRTIVEAYAKGTPAIIARQGAMAELVDERRGGFAFEPGDARDLAAQVHRLLDHAADHPAMRAAARARYEQGYTAEANYELLMEIYRRAAQRRVESREPDSAGASSPTR
jgi:glycosyltransferase involved in cell wall biosynthesis